MILGQKDPRWANIHLGTSNYYIWAKGCLITELAEILDVTPDVVNERLNAVGGFAPDKSGQVSLVIWKKIEEAFPGIRVNRVWSYDNDDVLAQLAADRSVVVEVPAAPIGGQGSHWVRFVGDHKLHDPWGAVGSERPTSDFPNPTGYAVFSGKFAEPVAEPVVAPAVEEKPAEAPAPAVVDSLSYKGLDLNNLDSVRAAIDAWKDVVDGVYIRKDIICQALEVDVTYSPEALVESIKVLKKDFKEQVLVATGLPAAEQIEGQGPAIVPAPQPAPVVPTLSAVPQHEKESLLNRLHHAEAEIRALLGLA